MKNDKKFKVVFSKEAQSKLNSLPDDIHEKLENLIKGFKDGSIDPSKAGQPVNWVKLNERLMCPECNSNQVEWLLDKNSNEVTFNCLICSESFWMTNEEYMKAVKNNPSKLIR